MGTATGAGRPLRVAVLLDTLQRPAWEAKAIEQIASSAFAELALVIKVPETHTSVVSPILRLHLKLDRLLFSGSADAFDILSVKEGIEGIPVHEWDFAADRGSAIPTQLERELQAYDLDVIVQFSGDPLEARRLLCVCTEIWWHYFGDPLTDSGSPVGFDEVRGNVPCTQFLLMAWRKGSERPTTIFHALMRTDWEAVGRPRSVGRNRNHVAWRAASIAASSLDRVGRLGFDVHRGEALDEDVSAVTRFRKGNPSSLSVIQLQASVTLGYLRDKLGERKRTRQWNLLFRIGDQFTDRSMDFDSFERMQPPAGHFYADPFCVEYGDSYYVFFEDFDYAAARGVISVIEIAPSGSRSEPRVVLERDYHLSYPFMLEHDDEIFMIPESRANATVDLYRCLRWPDEWVLERTLLEGIHAADATIAKIHNGYWMFVNVTPEKSFCSWDELHLYYADSPFDPWTSHPLNPIKIDVRSARSAGRVFHEGGKYYRPAQDCSRKHGYALTINEIEAISKAEYVERVAYQIRPDWDPSVVGIHTLNRAGSITVVDAEFLVPRDSRGS